MEFHIKPGTTTVIPMCKCGAPADYRNWLPDDPTWPEWHTCQRCSDWGEAIGEDIERSVAAEGL